MARLGRNSYGKSAIRLVKVERRSNRHEIRDLTVDVALEGEFTRAHAEGDNSAVLPTDTMKNAVYAKAREHTIGEPEEFARLLAEHFLEASPVTELARVRVAEHPWRHLRVGPREQDTAFERAGRERRMAEASVTRDEAPEISGGLDDLFVLKSGHAGFEGYPHDHYTTLPETADRILAATLSVKWRYVATASSYGVSARAVRATLLESFAEHESKSVQHTLYAVGKAVLDGCPDVEEINLRMPSKHHVLVDLTPFGLDNPNEVFVATSEPYALMQATVQR